MKNAWVRLFQGGITCGAIDEPRKSSKAIDERVIINFRNKNVVIERFRDKNVVIAFPHFMPPCKVQICKICKTFEIWKMPKTCKVFYSFASEVKKRYISHIYICQVKMHNIFSSRPHAQNGEAVTQQIPRALQFIVHSPQETSSGGQSQEERKTPNLLISKVVKVSNYKELMM